MTTTNRAFIKAYRHDAPQPTLAAPAAWSHLRPTEPAGADALRSSVEYVSVLAGGVAETIDACSTAPEASDSQFIGAPAGGALELDSGRTRRSVPETELDIASDRRGPRPPRLSSAATTVNQSLSDLRAQTLSALPRRLDRGSAPKRPLSSFTPSRTGRSGEAPAVRARSASAAPRGGTGFQPGTTIASFRWPSVCRALWQECSGDLDRVGEQLLAASGESQALVGVIGMFPGRGCTTTLLSLAGPLAARGGRVVIVDGNFRTPTLGSLLGVESDTTWQDVLAHGVPVGDAVVRAVDDNLDLLPFQPHPANHGAPQWSVGLHASVTAGVLRYAYDVALVDLGAFFNPESQPTLLELVRSMRLDSAIAVAGPEGADPRDLDTLGEYLIESGCQLLGTIENRAA